MTTSCFPQLYFVRCLWAIDGGAILNLDDMIWWVMTMIYNCWLTQFGRWSLKRCVYASNLYPYVFATGKFQCPQRSFPFSQLRAFPVSSESYPPSAVHWVHQELGNSVYCQRKIQLLQTTYMTRPSDYSLPENIIQKYTAPMQHTQCQQKPQ